MRKRIGAWLVRVGETIRKTWQRIVGRDELPGRLGLPPASRSTLEASATAQGPQRQSDASRPRAEAQTRAPARREAVAPHDVRPSEQHARRDGEEQARRSAAEKARREAEEKARREAEEKARREAEEKARREAEEKARREAEEKARREAEEQAHRDADERARLEAEAQARRDAQEQAQRDADERARLEAEEQARRDAEDAALLEAEAQARLEAAQAESLDFELRMAEAETLEAAELAAQEKLDELVAASEQLAADATAARGAADGTEPGPEAPGEASTEPPAPETTPADASAGPPAPRPPSVEVPSDYVPAAESEHELYRVETEAFAGPLDLLLFLIRRHALDIFDIPMAFVCERYLEYLKTMQQLEIDVAAEFLAMAAELLHIKSKMLLPRPAEVEEDEDEIDPRAELVRRLLEYQKYKDAAERLAGLNRTGRDTFGRDPEELPAPDVKAPLAEVSLFALIEAFDAVLKRQKPELRHQVMMEAVSVRQRIRALIDIFAERHQVPFVELLGELAERIDIVVSFLAVLEMARLRLLRVYQSTEGEIYLEARFATAEEAHGRLQGIDTTLDGEPASGEGA